MFNESFYTPQATWTDTLESWMALNDVNILDVTEDHILYEYAYLSDGRKWWAKTAIDRDPSLTIPEEFPYIISSVEQIRRVVDQKGRTHEK